MNTSATDAILAKLIAAQAARVAELEAELATLIAEGNDYYAHQVRAELIAARCPARLVHRAE